MPADRYLVKHISNGTAKECVAAAGTRGTPVQVEATTLPVHQASRHENTDEFTIQSRTAGCSQMSEHSNEPKRQTDKHPPQSKQSLWKLEGRRHYTKWWVSKFWKEITVLKMLKGAPSAIRVGEQVHLSSSRLRSLRWSRVRACHLVLALPWNQQRENNPQGALSVDTTSFKLCLSKHPINRFPQCSWLKPPFFRSGILKLIAMLTGFWQFSANV